MPVPPAKILTGAGMKKPKKALISISIARVNPRQYTLEAVPAGVPLQSRKFQRQPKWDTKLGLTISSQHGFIIEEQRTAWKHLKSI